MTSLFRSSQQRSQQQPPPSSFRRAAPSLAGAVSSADRSHRRASRTPDDFEAALRSEDTVVLQEGRDMHTLGVHDTPQGRARSGSVASLRAQPPSRTSTDTISGRRQTVSTPKNAPHHAPATPVVIPPTPVAATDDTDARRRSMYRAAGTASSPDLATLVRKARDTREQDNVAEPQDYLEPAQPPDRVRTKSSTSSAFEFIENSPAKTPLNKARDRAFTSPDPNGDGSPRPRKPSRRLAKAEKVLGVNRTPNLNDQAVAYSDIGEGRSDREGKRSMRNKTSAFFGKMLGHGQGSMRDKSRADSHSTPTTPSATQHHTFAPPVPAIPLEYRQTNFASNSSPAQSPYFPSPGQSPYVESSYSQSPSHSPYSSNTDPFTSTYPNPVPAPRLSKPLPPIHKQFPPAPVDDRSDSEDDIPLSSGVRPATAMEARPQIAVDTRATLAANTSEYDRNATVTQRRPGATPSRPGVFPRQGKDGRRRSMSVGDIDVQKLILEARARAEARGESALNAPVPRGSIDTRSRSGMDVPPRASVDARRHESEDEDEDRTEEGPSALPVPHESPLDQRRMSKRARAVVAWDRDVDVSGIVDGFGGDLTDALGGIRGSPRNAQGPSGVYSIRPVKTNRSSSDGTSGSGLGLGLSAARGHMAIPPSPLAARRPSTASAASASSSSMLAVPGRYISSSSSNGGHSQNHGQGLVSQPSMESMRTVSSETAGIYMTPPSSAIMESNPTLPIASSGSSVGTNFESAIQGGSGAQTSTSNGSQSGSGTRPLPIPGSSISPPTPTSPLSGSLPPRSASLRLSPRALPRRHPPRHRSAASASEPSLVDPVGASIRLVSEPAGPIGRGEAGGQGRTGDLRHGRLGVEQRLVSDPMVGPNTHWGDDEARSSAMTSKVDRRGSTGGASVDIESRGQGLAARCWQEDESFLAKEKIAEWLGGTAAINKVALRYYMDYFDFGGMRLDSAFRHLCTKLYLKAETQQVDRILEEYSRRFWDCNRGTVYGSSSIVHAISYSLLLLNTDLHIAELSSHMSKSQFVRNTWAVIQEQIRAPAPDVVIPRSPASGSQTPGSTHTQLASSGALSEPVRSPMSLEHGRAHLGQDHGHFPGESTPELVLDDESSQLGDGLELVTRKQRSGSLNSWRSGSKEGVPLSSNASNPSVMMDTPDPKTPTGSMYTVVSARGWDSEMEMLLKDMYTAVKNQQILQPLTGLTPHERQSMSLSPGMASVSRSRSQRGQSGQGGDRITSLKRGSIRGLQSLLGNQSPYGSNTSVDGRISPSPSFATSIGEGVPTSNSSLFAPTLGFASNLSHTIIKEAQEDDVKSVNSDMTNSTTLSITDEELALLGPPWAKEGMLGRKQYWESAGKRAKIKTWMDVFVVIQKGELSMFVFGESHSNAAGGASVGGGNWLSNANCVGKVVLAHALAHSLPPPGYNRQRPHCFVLTLASGAVFFFQAGTEDLVNEWVMTCNYWAARQSKEPLSGGVSNMEYGWNRASELLHSPAGDAHPDRKVDTSDSQSVRSGRGVSQRVPPSPFNSERILIYDWTGPMHSVVPSTHDEETQMEALQRQANLLKHELVVHNELRQPMLSLYLPRSANATKASNNWERRSQYLLSEIVKYDSYVDSLRSAMSQRLRRRGDKALERALVVSSPDDDELDGVVYGAPAITGSGPAGRYEVTSSVSRATRQQVIIEDEEPSTPLPSATRFTS